MFKLFIILLCAAIIVSFGTLICWVEEHNKKVNEYAHSIGCENLGHAKGSTSVYYFECDGKVELRKFKNES